MAGMWGPLSTLITQAQSAIAGQPKIRVAAQAVPSGAADPGDDAAPAPRRRGRGSSKGRGGPRRGRAGGSQRAKRGQSSTRREAGADGSPTTEDSASAQRSTAPRSTAAPTGQVCPQCGKPLVSRTSKYGPFIGCSGFPKCRYVAKQDKSSPEL